MRKILEYIEGTPVNFAGWLAGFAGILFIRFFLENMLNGNPSGLLAADASTIIHYSLFFAVVTLSFILVLKLTTGKDITAVSKITLFGLLITWLPPIIDAIRTAGSGAPLLYITAGANQLVSDFFSYFGNAGTAGISLGIRLEVILGMIFAFFYVRYAGRSYARAALAAVLTYAIAFVWLALPSIIAAFYLLPQSVGFEVLEFLRRSFDHSVYQNFFHPALSFTPQRALELHFNLAMSQIFYVAVFILAAAWFYVRSPRKLLAIFRNSRLVRIGHYFLMLAVGLALAVPSPLMNRNWTYILSILTLFLAYYCAWLFAVCANDLEDKDADAISNPARPLVANELSESEVKNIGLFFLIASLVGGFLTGLYSFFFLAVFTAAYYIYSVKPLQLKRVPILASFLIAIAGAAAILSGFFLTNAERTITSFPLNWLTLILIGITLGANFRDIKDIDGDRATGIKTLPVIFGGRHGKKVVGVLTAVAFLLPPLFLKLPILWFASVPAAVAVYVAINQRNYREGYVCAVYFLYVALSYALYAIS